MTESAAISGPDRNTPASGWSNPYLRAALVVAALGLFVWHKPWALITPQLWAEDGSIFLTFNDLHGVRAFAEPYMGYLHTIPRIIAWLASHTLDPAWWPTFYNWSAFLISAAVIARTFSPRLRLPFKPFLALAFFLGPQTGEVFFTITNIQWFTAVLLIEQAIIAPPRNGLERATDYVILALVGLTGPFVIAFWPLLAWRTLRQRTAHDVALLVLATICAAIQSWFVLTTGPKFEWPPFAPLRFFEIVSQHLLGWALVGNELAVRLPPAVLIAIGLGPTIALLVWSLRPHPRRTVRAVFVSAFGLIFVAMVYRSRPDTWDINNLVFGERYFFLPRLLLFWLLILEFDSPARWLRWSTRICAGLIVVANAPHYSIPSPPNYHWSAHCDPIRRGIPANIPILPEGWTLEYRGRPGKS